MLLKRPLGRDRSGVVSLEFALLLPLLLVLGFGCFEVGWVLQAEQKAQAVADDMAQLVAASAETTGTAYIPGDCSVGYLEIDSTPNAARMLLQISVASVTNYAGTGVTVDWNQACAFSSAVNDPAGLATTAPSLVQQPGDSVIVTQIALTYWAPIHFVLTPESWTLTAHGYARPYNGAPVQLSP